MLTVFSLLFLLAVCDPSPYDNTKQSIRSEFWLRRVPFPLVRYNGKHNEMNNRPIRPTQCCTQFKSRGVKES